MSLASVPCRCCRSSPRPLNARKRGCRLGIKTSIGPPRELLREAYVLDRPLACSDRLGVFIYLRPSVALICLAGTEQSLLSGHISSPNGLGRAPNDGSGARSPSSIYAELLRSLGCWSRDGMNSYHPVRYCTPESSVVTHSKVLPSATSALPAKLATAPR